MGQKQETFTLPSSGLEVTIRRPGILTLRDVYRALPLLTDPKIKESEAAEIAASAETMETMVRMAQRCCISPRFVDSLDPKEGERSVDDLDLADSVAICLKVIELANVDRDKKDLGPSSETSTAS